MSLAVFAIYFPLGLQDDFIVIAFLLDEISIKVLTILYDFNQLYRMEYLIKWYLLFALEMREMKAVVP